MRSLRSENKDATKLRSLEHWADIEVRSAVRCAATRRIVRGRVYRPDLADDYARWRRGRSRRNERFGASDWLNGGGVPQATVEPLSKPQAGCGARPRLSISHETIYRHIWRDRKRGGRLYLHLRCSPKQRRKRYGSYDSPRSSIACCITAISSTSAAAATGCASTPTSQDPPLASCGVEPFTPEEKESKSKGENDELEARHLRQVCNFRWPDLCSFRWPLTESLAPCLARRA